ncbi:diaminopimelate epimerase [Methanothermus fervidus DSM 2088]|uniref:Diaminopimelate epimerase n=1 Tax=Methanothermus fervidus (strain ATCC 43054 / DSM 2088 / JCM 10308 / V24 S) TaxID=523846 RepID=E3GW34_METFV|nr:diaminopimelate epimerase [Methanothermus fervidus]ADP77799.1 diaminopimelate epimerase [Methanothermus fervidus DSM 2088]
MNTKTILFTKMHALGNDYILIDETRGEIVKEREKPEFVKKICDRNFGVGGDGVIFVSKSDNLDIKFRIFNADGSEAEMCGNGIRCFAKYVYEKGILRKKRMKVETLAGEKILNLKTKNNLVESIKVDMGLATFKSEKIPVKTKDKTFINKVCKLNDKKIKLSAVNVGNPHTVIFVDEVSRDYAEKIGPVIENHPIFPERTNVNFVKVLNPNEIKMITWERGVGITLACGTGAVASTIVGRKLGKLNKEVTVNLPGGRLKIEIYEKNNKIGAFMEGKATMVFEGILSMPWQ